MIIKNNPEDFLSYLEDTSNLKGSADALYIPETEEELQSIVRDCAQKKIPLTCSAARTGTTGGCVPFEGVLLSLERLNRIIDIDTENKRVRLEAGVPLRELEERLNTFGLTFRAQPTESLAFVGAATSTCASGVRGFRYGSIRNYINRLAVILGDGTRFDIHRGDVVAKKRVFSFSLSGRDWHFHLPSYALPKVKSQAGYFVNDDMDLIDLFIGSEGTLGVIAEVELAVQRKASDIFDGVAFLGKESEGLDFVRKVKELKHAGKLNPTSLEFFDARSLELLRKEYLRIPVCGCAVYFEQEVEDDTYKYMMDSWAALLESFGIDFDTVWFGDSEGERKKIYSFRYRLPELINESLRHHNQTKLSADIAIPDQYLKAMYAFYQEKADQIKVSYVNFGHIGESHLHFNFLPKDNAEHARAQSAIGEFIRHAATLGGTVSAEHGIGKLKKPYLEVMYGRRHIREMARLKEYFDNNFILGPDNIFNKNILNEL